MLSLLPLPLWERGGQMLSLLPLPLWERAGVRGFSSCQSEIPSSEGLGVGSSLHDGRAHAATIRLKLFSTAGQIILSVEDQGVGMSPEEIRQVLKPYARGKRAGRLNARGIGLGLALCQHVVQAHGGRIQIQSVPGQGSKFSVILPGRAYS